jgi:hypothetical protein
MKINYKLINLFILTLFILIFLPLISEAAYNVYLKNGRVMTGVDEVREENGKIKIYKKGIVLELPKANILRIEEYGTDLIKKEIVEEKVPEEVPTEEQLPEYMRYDKFPATPPVVYEEEELEETEDDIEEETEEAEETMHKLKTTGSGEIEEGELQPGPQLKELRRQEEEGTLPEQFTPYKDFLDQRYQKQKQHFEGQ